MNRDSVVLVQAGPTTGPACHPQGPIGPNGNSGADHHGILLIPFTAWKRLELFVDRREGSLRELHHIIPFAAPRRSVTADHDLEKGPEGFDVFGFDESSTRHSNSGPPDLLR